MNLNYYYSKEIRQYLQEILDHFQNELNMSGSMAESRSRSNPATQREPDDRHYENNNTSAHLLDIMRTAVSTNFDIDQGE